MNTESWLTCLSLISSFFCSRKADGIPAMFSWALRSRGQRSFMNSRAFLPFRKPVKLICIILPSGFYNTHIEHGERKTEGEKAERWGRSLIRHQEVKKQNRTERMGWLFKPKPEHKHRIYNKLLLLLCYLYYLILNCRNLSFFIVISCMHYFWS